MPRKGEKCSEATKRSIRRAQSKYTTAMCGKIIDWFIAPKTEDGWRAYIDVCHVIEGDLIDGRMPVYIPTLTGFCDSVGVSLPTLYKWADTYEEFGDAYEEAMEIKRDLINTYALQGLVNPNFAKYMMESWRPRERKRPQLDAEGSSEQAESASEAREGSGGVNVLIKVQLPKALDEDGGEGDGDAGGSEH